MIDLNSPETISRLRAAAKQGAMICSAPPIVSDVWWMMVANSVARELLRMQNGEPRTYTEGDVEMAMELPPRWSRAIDGYDGR